MKSIIMNLDVKKCFLCGDEGPVEVHHCMHGTANRRLADRDGLVVNLCPECHRWLHATGDGDLDLMKVAQAYWIRYNLSDAEHWIARYGKNFL